MKLGKLLIITVLSIACFAGCNPKDTSTDGNNVNPQTNAGTVAVESEKKAVEPTRLPEKIATWSELNRYTGDVDGDGADEDVILMTSAERGVDDEIIWDDGQDWILYVKDRDISYVLLNKYVQAGNVYFEVLDYYTNNGAEPRINVIVSTGAGFNLNSYSFDNERNIYLEETVYDTSEITEGGTNRRFSSVPEIIK